MSAFQPFNPPWLLERFPQKEILRIEPLNLHGSSAAVLGCGFGRRPAARASDERDARRTRRRDLRYSVVHGETGRAGGGGRSVDDGIQLPFCQVEESTCLRPFPRQCAPASWSVTMPKETLSCAYENKCLDFYSRNRRSDWILLLNPGRCRCDLLSRFFFVARRPGFYLRQLVVPGQRAMERDQHQRRWYDRRRYWRGAHIHPGSCKCRILFTHH